MSPPFVSTSASIGFALLLAGVVSRPVAGYAQASTGVTEQEFHDARTREMNAVTEAFAGIEERFLNGVRAPGAEEAAYAEAARILDRGLPAYNGVAAAVTLYRTMDLSARLPQRTRLLKRALAQTDVFRLRDTIVTSRALFTLALGTLHHTLADHEAALIYFDSLLHYDLPADALHMVGSARNLRGFAYREKGELVAARDEFAAAAAVYRRNSYSPFDYVDALVQYSQASLDLGEVDEALRAAGAATDTLGAIPHGDSLMREAYRVHMAYARALLEAGADEPAISAAQRALTITVKRQDPVRIAEARLDFARLYLRRRRTTDAAAVLLPALDHLPPSTQPDLRQKVLAELVRIYDAEGRFELALRTQTEAHYLADSLLRATQAIDILNVKANEEASRARHELGVAQAEARALAASDTTRRAVLVCCVSLLILLGGSLYQLVRRLRKKQRQHDVLEGMVAERTAEIEAQRAELWRHAEDLQRSNTELERFAYIASHDLKTPIRNVTSFLNLIDRRLPDGARPAVGEYIGIALTAARQMNELVGGVLRFSRINADLAEGAEEIQLAGFVALLRQQLDGELAARNATLEVVGDATVYGPAAHLGQVFTNLITNGLKYNRSPFPSVRVAIAAGAERVTVTFADNGIGIAPEYHDTVFELFKRLHTSDTYEGSGVGLATARKVAERLGGNLTLASVPGEGSTFTLTLPADGRRSVHRAAPGEIEWA